MASPNNNLSVLPWYTSLDKQNAKKWYAFGNVWPLVMPTNRIIPYQFVVPFTNVAIAGSSIISLDTKDIYDGQSSHTLVTRVDYTVVKSNGFAVSLPEGRYYAKIDFANGVTYYSEVFTLVSNISDYVKIQYWNDDILVYNGGEINYEDEFKFEMYLCTTIGKPEYSFEEEVTKRLGYKFPELQVSNKLYKFTCIGPEYLCDAMRLIRLSDYIKIVSKDDSYNALTFSYDAKWETQGDLASIEVEFETDTIIQKLSSFNRGQREGFYNALLVDINEALLFDENTVALYYDEYRSSTRAVDVEGKLIRELELITEVGENSQIVVDTGQGPAVRMNLYELIKNFIKRDSNEIIEGLWTFKKGLKTGNDKDGEPTGEITENGYLKYIALIVKEFISSEKFVSGLLGEGFKIYEKNGTWYIECDNLTVRQVLTVFEMIISKLRAVNGGLVVSPGNNTIKSVSETDMQYVLEVEDDIEIAKDDFIRHQVFSTSHAKNYWVKVINIAEGKIYTNKSEYNGAVPAKGDEIIVMGNATNSKRQGLIYITAAEDGRPRIEILEGVKDKTLAATNRTVLGNLDDIQDSAFEDDYQPSGSGLYCDNAFLRGIFILRSGKNVETEIDAAQKAAQEAASKAANAEKTANDAKDRLNKWADDGFISPAEKLSLIQEGQDLKAEKLEIVNDATKYTIDTTSYIAAYNDYLTQLQYYTQAEPENIEVLPAFEQAQTKYYTQRTAILNAISAKAKELVDATNATADAAKKAADAAKTTADAAKINADKANSLLADIANDNKLTAQEKQQTKKEWDVIVSEKPKNDASADKYGVSKTNYGNAYNALSSYITPLLSSLNTTSDITGTDFRAKFKAYYDARTDLLNAISAKAKELVDAADKKIESVKTELSAVDGKITLAVKTAKEEAISASKTYTNSEIKVVKDQIALKVDSATVDALTGRVTTAESKITQNANSISLKITASEATNIANNAVNNLQIGGTNLLVNTDFLHNRDYWSGGDVDSSVTLQGRNSLRMITSGLTSDSWRGGEQGDTPYLSAKQGDVFTISLFSRTDNISSFDRGANMEIRYYNSSGGRITVSAFNIKPSTNNTWTRFVGTGTCPAGTVKVSAVWYNTRNGRIWVNGIKLEVGKKATDWTRSPHDSPTTQDVKSSFTIDTGGISMLGKKLSLTGMVTFNSLASDAQGKINTAKSTADAAKTAAANAQSRADAAYNKKIELTQLGTTVISGGFIKTSLIKADEIIVSKLSGATGTFKQLQAVGSDGSVKGTLRLDGDRLWYDGDQYQQGTKDGRSLRYYLSDAWVRGNFGARTRTTLLVQGSGGYFYPKGAYKAGVYKSFERGTASDGRTYYKLPCYGLDGDYAGMPVDLIVFNVTSSNQQRFYELQLAVTQKVNMINCNDNYPTNVLIYCNGNYLGLPGGSVHYAWNVLPFMNPQPTANVLGRGLLFGGSNDNDWR